MAYFQMDDGFDSDSRVMRAGTAAFGLYARCGIWVADQLTDGFVPSELATLYGTREWIEKLVASGLWSPVEGGFVMPDYLGKHGNKPAVVVLQRRAEAAARQQRFRDGKNRRSQQTNTSRVTSRVTNGVTHGGSHASQSDPSLKGEEGAAPLRGSPPPSTHTLTTGRVVCAAHHQEMPCISCAADSKAGGDELDLDVRPPRRDPAARHRPDED